MISPPVSVCGEGIKGPTLSITGQLPSCRGTISQAPPIHSDLTTLGPIIISLTYYSTSVRMSKRQQHYITINILVLPLPENHSRPPQDESQGWHPASKQMQCRYPVVFFSRSIAGRSVQSTECGSAKWTPDDRHPLPDNNDQGKQYDAPYLALATQ